jgi:16S rRNA (guanine527-N7)-methyltransferase
MFHVKLKARAIVERLTEVQVTQLRRFAALLRERGVPLGLISPTDADRLWERHVLDSLRGLACVGPSDDRALDIGSGAGLPGIPLGIALPRTRFLLIEPKRRRAAFLELATEALGLANVSVLAVAAGEVRERAGLCLARALAPPADSWRAASPLLTPGGRLLYWAGRSWTENQAKRLAPLGASAEICLEREFQWQGPLVIMRRFSTSPSRNHERA